MPFDDRTDAGRRLARRLGHLHDEDIVVLGLPRAGVPVAYEVARACAAPLDVLVVRKLGVPRQPELAFGAIGEHGVRVLNQDVIDDAGLRNEELADVEHAERVELERRVARYRAGRARESLAGRTVLVVDDGLATGATAEAALPGGARPGRGAGRSRRPGGIGGGRRPVAHGRRSRRLSGDVRGPGLGRRVVPRLHTDA